MLALLLRAGAVEVTYQGRRFRNAQDPQCRPPLTSNTAFRNASFTPRESIDLRTLTAAVRNFETLTGDEVDVEEGAIAEALKKLANEEIALLLPARAEVRANSLPGLDALDDYHSTLTTIQNAASDDCVRMLVGEGNSIKDLRTQARRIREALNERTLAAISQARRAVNEQWPIVAQRITDSELQGKAEQLERLLGDSSLYDHLPQLRSLSVAIAERYRSLYEAQHHLRYASYEQAVDSIRGQEVWPTVADTEGPRLLSALTQRMCEEPGTHDADQVPAVDFADDGIVCVHCHASLSQMESDVLAVDGLLTQALSRLIELTAPTTANSDRSFRHIRAAHYFSTALDSEDAVDEALKRLREDLVKLLAQGASIIVE